MKRLLFICFLLISTSVVGQVRVQEEEILKAIGNTPQEEVFVHYNGSLFLAGEYLYYKLYNLNSKTGEFSDLSKIAYVELVGKEGKPVFRHKLALEEGVGQGDFFLPPSVPSGNYKLLGYTRWMLNGEEQQLFMGDVVIVNPYTNDQEELLPGTGEKDTSRLSASFSSDASFDAIKGISSPSGLGTDADTYGRREKVTVGLEKLEAKGKYSVSVRKLEPVQNPEVPSAIEIALHNATPFIPVTPSTVSLPELRGELITGILVPMEGKEDISPAKTAVALSIPGKNYILKIAGANEDGKFFFNMDSDNLEEEAVLQVLGEDRENFEVKLQEPPVIDYSKLDFGDFRLTPTMKKMIIDRSVYNQVENAYFEAKPDTLKISPELPPFYGKEMLVYQLDDYTRFKTIRETFVEIILFASIGRDASGDDMIRITGYNQAVNSSLPPLLVVDGVMLQEQGDFINYPAERIKSIGILRDKYFLGAEVFQGVVDVKTVEGNFNSGRTREYLHPLELLRPEPRKYYFRQTYTAEDNKIRIPDFRTQLLWVPELDLKEETQLEFFTSDVPGIYEISLEGFTAEGKPVSRRERIRVE